MGASWAVPAVRAGGAVEEPLPSTPILTLGYFLLNPSAQRVIRLFSVSEPTALRLPETPLVGAYGLMLLSTVTFSAAMLRELRAAAMVRILATNFMASFLLCCVFRFPDGSAVHAGRRGSDTLPPPW